MKNTANWNGFREAPEHQLERKNGNGFHEPFELSIFDLLIQTKAECYMMRFNKLSCHHLPSITGQLLLMIEKIIR